MKKFYILNNTSKPSGDSGEAAGGLYDMSNACSNCATGYKLIGNLPVKSVKFSNDFIQTLSGDYLISDKLYSFLLSSGVESNEIMKVISFSSKRELDYYFLNPELNFPKMLPESEGIITDEQCPVCKRNGFFGEVIFEKNYNGTLTGKVTHIAPKYKYHIDSNGFIEQSDIFYTWEHSGY